MGAFGGRSFMYQGNTVNGTLNVVGGVNTTGSVTVGGQLGISRGALSAPSIYDIADVDTGLNITSTNLQLVRNGAEMITMQDTFVGALQVLRLADAGWMFTSDTDSGFLRTGGLTCWREDGTTALKSDANGAVMTATQFRGEGASGLISDGDFLFANQPAAKTADFNFVQGIGAQIILMNGTALNFNLPASAKVGAVFYVKNIHATESVTIVRNTGQTIDAAAANFTMGPASSVVMTATGTLSWIVLAAYAGLGAG